MDTERMMQIEKGRARLRLAKANIEEAMTADHTDDDEILKYTNAAVELIEKAAALLAPEHEQAEQVASDYACDSAREADAKADGPNRD